MQSQGLAVVKFIGKAGNSSSVEAAVLSLKSVGLAVRIETQAVFLCEA